MRCCVPYFCYVCVAEASFDRLPLDLASSTHAPHDMMRPVNTTAQPKCRSGICKAGSAPFRRSLGMGGGLWSSVVGCNCNPVIEICPLSGALRRGTTRYGTYFYFPRIASHRIASISPQRACRPGIPTHETKSQPYRPGRGGHNVGPWDSARGTTTKLYTRVWGPFLPRFTRFTRIQGSKVTQVG